MLSNESIEFLLLFKGEQGILLKIFFDPAHKTSSADNDLIKSSGGGQNRYQIP
jgi:hypothetical protein